MTQQVWLGLMLLCLAFTFAGMYWRNPVWMAIAALSWLGMFAHSGFGHGGATTDYWTFNMVFLVLSLVCFTYFPLIMYRTKKKEKKEQREALIKARSDEADLSNYEKELRGGINERDKVIGRTPTYPNDHKV